MFEKMEVINEKYDGQWVYLVDCEQDEFGSVVSGRVVLHNENRDNVIRRLKEFEDVVTLTSFRYAGRIPEGVSILL
jgi:hypothetical protein